MLRPRRLDRLGGIRPSQLPSLRLRFRHLLQLPLCSRPCLLRRLCRCCGVRRHPRLFCPCLLLRRRGAGSSSSSSLLVPTYWCGSPASALALAWSGGVWDLGGVSVVHAGMHALHRSNKRVKHRQCSHTFAASGVSIHGSSPCALRRTRALDPPSSSLLWEACVWGSVSDETLGA